MAVTQSRLAFLLSQSPVFQGRVQMVITSIAGTVLTEIGVGAAHAARAAYAKAILLNPAQYAAVASCYVAQATVIVASTTMEDEGPRCTATDIQMGTQVTADWSKMAGVDSGT